MNFYYTIYLDDNLYIDSNLDISGELDYHHLIEKVEAMGDKNYCYLFTEWFDDEIILQGRCDDLAEVQEPWKKAVKMLNDIEQQGVIPILPAKMGKAQQQVIFSRLRKKLMNKSYDIHLNSTVKVKLTTCGMNVLKEKGLDIKELKSEQGWYFFTFWTLFDIFNGKIGITKHEPFTTIRLADKKMEINKVT